MLYDFTPFLLSLKLASLTTTILFVMGIPIAYLIATTESKLKILANTILTMPLVLPPSVLGFYLLILFSPQNFFGNLTEKYFNTRLVFFL